MARSRCSWVRYSAFVALGAVLALGAAAAPAGAQADPTTTSTTAAAAPAPDPQAPTTTTTAADDHDHHRDGRDHDGDHRDGRHRDGHRDDQQGDEHHDGEPAEPTTTTAGPQPRQDRAVRAHPAPTSATTAARREASVHHAGDAVAGARSTTTTGPQPTTAPSTAAASVERSQAVPAQGINASLRHNESTPLDGELVSRRVAGPVTAGFVALAILLLLLDGGRRRTRSSR